MTFSDLPILCTISGQSVYLSVSQSCLSVFPGGALPNEQFWSEWTELRAQFSPALRNLLNLIFVLTPSLRGTLQDLLKHAWVSSGTRQTPEEIRKQMEARCETTAECMISVY